MTDKTPGDKGFPLVAVHDGRNYGRIDNNSGAFMVIDYAHHEIHAGDHFTVHHSAASKNDGTTINIYLKTPNTTKYCHMFMKWSASGAAYGRIYEAPTITANTGTNATAVYNRNRNSSTASTVVDNATTPAANKVGLDVTKTGNGTIIFNEFSGAAKQQKGESRNDNEYMLDANTAYLFEVESDAAGLTLAITLDWYEHIDLGQE